MLALFLVMMKFGDLFSACFAVLIDNMISSTRQCPGVAGKVCNCFLPAMDKDPNSLCTNCLGKECNTAVKFAVVTVMIGQVK